MLLVLSCKTDVIYLFLFVYLFVSDFCICSRAKVSTRRSERLILQKNRSADRLEDKKNFLILIIKKHPLVC